MIKMNNDSLIITLLSLAVASCIYQESTKNDITEIRN